MQAEEVKTLDSPIPFKGDFINGEFIKADSRNGFFKKTSPCNLNELILEVDFQNSHIDSACFSARKAFEDWSLWPMEERMEALNKVKQMFKKNQEELAETISRETGKPLWEARLEAGSVVAKFDVTFKYSSNLLRKSDLKKSILEPMALFAFAQGVFLPLLVLLIFQPIFREDILFQLL